MEKWLLIICCGVFVMASVLTTGLTRALIDIGAFVVILALVWRINGSTKVNDIQ